MNDADGMLDAGAAADVARHTYGRLWNVLSAQICFVRMRIFGPMEFIYINLVRSSALYANPVWIQYVHCTTPMGAVWNDNDANESMK